MENGLTNEQIFDIISSAMETKYLDEIEELVEEYKSLCDENDLEYSSYEKEVFAIAVRTGNEEYIEEHAEDFDLNSAENYWGDPYCPFLNETEDEGIRQVLLDHGAFVDWENYDTCPFATDTSNWFVISFTADFQEEVFGKILEYLGYDEDEFFETVEDWDQADSVFVGEYSLSDLMKYMEWEPEDGEIRFQDFGYTTSENGAKIMDVLEELGYELDFIGTQSKFETTGVYYLPEK